MNVVDERKRYFDDQRLNGIAWTWGDVARVDQRVTGFWFETDVRQDLLTPKKYFAFHVAIRDDHFDEFIAERATFVSKAGSLQAETAQKLIWPYAQNYSGKKVPDDEREVFVCWLTYDDNRKIDLFLERHSKLRNIPRGFCRPLIEKDVPYESLVRHRIGAHDRVIMHRPTRPKGT